MADLEQDYDEMERETARYSPRKASHEVGDQASHGGILAGDARMSPSKPQAASRRQRNAPSGRVHDIEFATEISTSLLAQLRQLQGVLAEKEDALKQAQDQNARLQQTSERFDHRLRELDDTEQRYKEQTWQLESQVQDLAHQMKDAAMREQRLTQHLNAAKTGRSTIEREYDELRQSHEQLSDDHGHLYKQHETEVTGMQRALASGDEERTMLNQQIEELMIHNERMEQEMQERLRAAEAARESDMDNGEILGMDRPITPDGMGSHSPVKATPRVAGLEAETLKSSLNHAHRMIQNMKNNIHREKTEKQELKRMLQDARDELEARRADVGGVNPGAIKRRKPQQDNQRTSRPDMLGAAGAPREEIINDPLWEEYEDSPTRPRPARRGDQYDLTTDASDAFETANEDGTDTEGFRTADDLARESDGDQTETEGPQQRRSRFAAMARKRQTSSFESTASDDDGLDDYDLTTPPANQTGYRIQLDRIGNHSGKSHDSPASFVSRSSNPRQNLAAELDDLDNSSIMEGTPVSRGTTSRGASPNTEGFATPVLMRKASIVRTTSRPTPAPMVNTGMMTEPWQPREAAPTQGEQASNDVLAASGPAAALAGAAMAADGSTNLQIPGDDLAKRRSFDPSMAPPPLIPSPRSLSPNPQSPRTVSSPVNLTMSAISSQHIEPIAPEPVSIESDRAETPKAQANNGLRVQTVSAPADKYNSEPSPVSMNGFAEAISPIATPTEEPANSSISFVKGLMNHASIPIVKSPPSPEEPRVRDFAMEQKPAFDGRDANKVLLEPHLRVARDPPQSEREFEEPTLQIATPLYEDPRKSTFALPYANPTATEKGKARAAVVSSTGTQTLVSGDQIENLLKERRKSFAAALPQVPNPTAKNGTNERTMSMGSVNGRPDAAAFLQNTSRPTSAGSARGVAFPPPQADLPPLPANHQEVIAAAARTSGLNSMMPPPMPPSAWRPPSASRNRAPSGTFSHSPSRQATTPRHSSVNGRGEHGTPTPRRSSVSSLQSELDERFGMTPRHYIGGEGFEIAPNTDPRMIQAITQTMIGEFLWKYTRKAGRSGEHSENRHKRFFWIHPYTRTLYWSNQDPAIPSQKELKAKSVAIEAVRVVSDENPIPAGLHTKSLVIVTPGRSIKFTAPTPQRHETWFNALSYLLLRKDPADEANAAVYGGSVNKLSDTLSSSNYTPDDIAEFNPAYSRSASRVTTGSRRSMGGSVPATPRSHMQSSSSLAARTASPQRSNPSQASLAARPNNATAAFGAVHPIQKFSQQAQPNYASMRSNTLDSIPDRSGGSYHGPNGPNGPNMSQTTFDSPTRAPPQYQQQQPYDASTTSLARAPSEPDNDGFKKPRPISTAPTVAESTRSGRSGKVSSMSGGWRASLFGRGRSKSRGRSGAPDNAAASSASLGGNNAQMDGANDTMSVPPLPAGGWGGPAHVGGVENVRACCDGESLTSP